MDSISTVHKRDWEKSGLPRITPRDKQRGIFLTAPDCVAMAANIAGHLKFLGANVGWVEKLIYYLICPFSCR